MPRIESALADLGGLETLSALDTPIHRLDPRVKVLTTLVFIFAVVSSGKYEFLRLIPFVLYPVALVALGEIPPGYLLRKLFWASPFILMIGALNPFLDRDIMTRIGGLNVTGGWVSFASIVLRLLLTLSAALILIATTGFNAVCLGLERMGLPQVLVVQFFLLYRYIFVLADEASRMLRAWSLRAVGTRRISPRVFASLLGMLLLRSLDRGHRIYTAMLSRGFDGEIRQIRPLHLKGGDILFLLVWSAFFVLARIYNLPELFGQSLLEIVQ